MNETSEQRRRWLKFMAALGAGEFAACISEAIAKGDMPLAPAIHNLEGTATVNGRDAKAGTPVSVGDKVSTGSRSQAVIVLGGDAFLLRSDTTLELKGKEGVLSELSVAAGKVLSVFAKKPVTIKAVSASIGIRGTAAYLEIDPASVYFCLCYGEAQLDAPGIAPVNLKTTHHDQPLLLHTGGPTARVEAGTFREHKDAELVLLESLVGREPPFMKSGMPPSKAY